MADHMTSENIWIKGKLLSRGFEHMQNYYSSQQNILSVMLWYLKFFDKIYDECQSKVSFKKANFE